MPESVIVGALSQKCQSIAYTYSEPISFYEYMYDTAKLASRQGLKNVWVTNGYINQKPLMDLCKNIDAANVDLKSLDDSIYKELNAGTLAPVLNTLKTLKQEKVWFEVTNLIVPSWTDDLGMIEDMADWLYKNKLDSYPLHFSRFTPQYKLTHLPPTPVSTLNKAREIALNSGLKYVYIGNVPGSDAQHTYCPKCNKIVVERKGYIIINNNVVDGSCKYCGEKIDGVWNL